MQEIEQLIPSSSSLHRQDSMRARLRSIGSLLRSPANLLRRKSKTSESQSGTMPALKIAGYSLVLMDPDGQVIWTREWDSGGVFEFGPRQRLWVFCGFTNHSARETEISEYEIELMGEDGAVIERFNNSFGDSIIVPPGESKHFPAEWRL
jgi:hypothetical protein